jgi:uncharacterized membrane protein YdfJ with MMPL/SSD domain
VAQVTPFTGGGDVPTVVDGLARIDVTLDAAPDSDQAQQTVQRLRDAVHAVPGSDAVVGGYTAVELDFDTAAQRDRIVIPLLLAVVFVLVALLLRALVAPLLLLGTVVLSFLAAIGVSTVVFQDVLGFPGVDSTFPLHAFVFLVALGIDYNIFLMTRVREESASLGTRRGTLAGLVLTGGVITSAGVVLAATFAALGVIPLVLMVELAFTVAFGVLLDTLVVRSVLVPALGVDVGRWMWWPFLLPGEAPNPAGVVAVRGAGTSPVVTQRAAAERALTERALAQRAAAEQALTERALAERAVAEQALTQWALTERLRAELQLNRQAMAERARAERERTQRAAAEPASAEPVNSVGVVRGGSHE